VTQLRAPAGSTPPPQRLHAAHASACFDWDIQDTHWGQGRRQVTAGDLLVAVPWLLFAGSIAIIAVLLVHRRPPCGGKPAAGLRMGRSPADERADTTESGQTGPPSTPRRP